MEIESDWGFVRLFAEWREFVRIKSLASQIWIESDLIPPISFDPHATEQGLNENKSLSIQFWLSIHS